MEKGKKPWMNQAERQSRGGRRQTSPTWTCRRVAHGTPAVEEEVGKPCRSPTNQKSKARVPVFPPTPPLHAHAHTGDTLTTLSTAQRGSQPLSLRRSLGEGFPSDQA